MRGAALAVLAALARRRQLGVLARRERALREREGALAVAQRRGDWLRAAALRWEVRRARQEVSRLRARLGLPGRGAPDGAGEGRDRGDAHGG